MASVKGRGVVLGALLLASATCLHLSGCLDGGDRGVDATAGGDDGGARPEVVVDESPGDAGADAGVGADANDALDAADACANCASGACTTGGCDPAVFITSKLYVGAIGDGGIASADLECSTVAAAAGLSGTFKAWLSAGGVSPKARFTSKSTRPYRLLDGTRIAVNFAGLAGLLEHSISVTEARVDIGFAYAWTATEGNGLATGGAGDCAGWTSADGGDKGAAGESDDTVSEWTAFGDIPCSTLARLYCFEQQP
jgi:hypothetical protein